MCYNNKGYITLLSLLVTGSIVLAIMLTLILSGIDSSKNSLVVIQSKEARALSNACVEEALEQIRDDNNFIGTGTISLGNGNCYYEVFNLGASNRNIKASSTVSNIVNKIDVGINQVSPNINVSSWQEVSDF